MSCQKKKISILKRYQGDGVFNVAYNGEYLTIFVRKFAENCQALETEIVV